MIGDATRRWLREKEERKKRAQEKKKLKTVVRTPAEERVHASKMRNPSVRKFWRSS